MIALLADFSAGDLFSKPLPIAAAWPWLLLPLCVGIAIVYKSVKCKSMKQVPKEATILVVFILLGIAAASIALAGVVRVLER